MKSAAAKAAPATGCDGPEMTLTIIYRLCTDMRYKWTTTIDKIWYTHLARLNDLHNKYFEPEILAITKIYIG